jgi:hypothetical protein
VPKGPAAELPFDDSRRLTGPNLHFPVPGAVLEVVGLEPGAALLEGWRTRVQRAVARLAWHATGAGPAWRTPCARPRRPTNRRPRFHP